LNILFLSSSYPIFKKGHWQNWSPRHETAKRLAEKGHNVFVIAPHTKGAARQEIVEGVKIYRFGNNAPLDFRKINPFATIKYFMQFYSKTKEVCKKHDIGIIHAFWAIPAGMIGIRAGKKFKIPVIVELLGSDVFFGLKNFFSRHFVKKAIENADYVFADGKSLIDFSVSEGVKIKRHWVHFYEPEIHNPNVQKLEEMRKKWGIQKNDFIIMLSRFKSKIYGAEFAIRAMPKIFEKIPNAKLLMVGKAGDYEKIIQGEIDRAGIRKKTVFTGFLDKADYWAAMKLSAVYLSPSLSDSTSVGLLEAMFAGLPIIASDIGDNSYWVKEGKNGKIVPAENSDKIGDAIIGLSKKDLKKIGSENKKILEKECCDWKKIIEKHIEIYSELLKK